MTAKKIKVSISIIIVGCLVFLATYKPDKINIEGNWIAKEILLNGEKIYPSEVDKYLKVDKEIIISNWSNEIYIPSTKKNILAKYEIVKNSDNNFFVYLTSKEKSLNGNFEINIDTINLGPLTYQVNMKLKSRKSHLYLEKTVHLKPWKPELPRKGQV